MLYFINSNRLVFVQKLAFCFIARSCNINYLSACQYLFYSHLIYCQCACLISAYNSCRAKGFNTWQPSYQCISLKHSLCAYGKGYCNNPCQCLWNSSNCHSCGKLQHFKRRLALEEHSQCKNNYCYHYYNLSKPFAELVHLLLQWRKLRLYLLYHGCNLSNLCLHSGCNNNSLCPAACNNCA